MPAVQIVHPPGHPAERAYQAVRGDSTVLRHNHWLVTGRQRRLLQAAFGETT
jgi:hypothetical protein